MQPLLAESMPRGSRAAALAADPSTHPQQQRHSPPVAQVPAQPGCVDSEVAGGIDAILAVLSAGGFGGLEGVAVASGGAAAVAALNAAPTSFASAIGTSAAGMSAAAASAGGVMAGPPEAIGVFETA